MEITKFSNYKDKKPIILLLHGLGSKIHEDQVKVLESLDINCVAIYINYKNGSIWETISNMKFDAIIGHSMGGYLSFYLSDYSQKPCLMFMPDFEDSMYKIQPIPQKVMDVINYPNKIAVVGSRDKDVDKDKEKDMLKTTKVYLEDSDHDVSIELFSKYVKIFINKYLNK